MGLTKDKNLITLGVAEACGGGLPAPSGDSNSS